MGYLQANALHDAGDITARDMGQLDSIRGNPLADPEVEVIDGTGFDPDEDFAGAWGGIWDVSVFKNVRTAVSPENDCFHALNSSIAE